MNVRTSDGNPRFSGTDLCEPIDSSEKSYPRRALIHLYVHGRGRGHATRCLAIAHALEADGLAFRAFVGPDGQALFSGTYPCEPIESLPPTLGAASSRVVARVRDATKAIREDRVRVVISDGDLPGLLAAKLVRRPAIAVGHGLVFAGCEVPPSLPWSPWMREGAKARISSVGARRCVAVNFVPLQTRNDRTRLARPSLDPRLHRAPNPEQILCYFRDGAPQVLRMLVELGHEPVVFAPADPGVPGVRFVAQDRERFVEAMAHAKVVIASAGSQLISESVGLGIPILALHARDDDEQQLNAAMVRDARLGDGCAFEALSIERLRRFVEHPPTGQLCADWAPEVATAVLDEVRAALV